MNMRKDNTETCVSGRVGGNDPGASADQSIFPSKDWCVILLGKPGACTRNPYLVTRSLLIGAAGLALSFLNLDYLDRHLLDKLPKMQTLNNKGQLRKRDAYQTHNSRKFFKIQ